MNTKYRDFFSINDDYFPSVNEKLINSGKVDWLKFYPHDTFISLLKDVQSILSRKQKLSIWVEGAYGTGKSHAVLTLKKILDASGSVTKEYFEKYGLSLDLYNQLQRSKDEGKIITIHRYGSSNIYGDRDLIVAIQESIMVALAENNITNIGEITLKESVIKWLSDDINKKYFNDLLHNRYKVQFDGYDTDEIIEKLETSTEQFVISLMRKIFQVADNEGLNVLKMDIKSLINWLHSIISLNNLKSIVFIWDEFTGYFNNNRRDLTGFQQLVELSQTDPFYFVIVTHKSLGLFHDTDKDKMKILGRFIRPTSNIELPENMAFKLIAAAMEKKKDPAVLKEWSDAANDFNSRLKDSRELVIKSAKITENELKDIFPIHPYTALLLKYLSSTFDSNQRSMFNFIKNDRGDDVKGFQWYIDNHGPYDNEYFLTIDMLWDFFYEKGKDNLSSDVLNILDAYHRCNNKNLTNDQQAVLKTILLLQAISLRVGDSANLFIADEKIIRYAYEGTYLETSVAGIAKKLVDLEILYKRSMGGSKYQYSAMVIAGDINAMKKLKDDLSTSKETKDLINEGEFEDILDLSGALSLRYEVRLVTVDTFSRTIKDLRNQDEKFAQKILALISFARNETEASSIVKMIKEAVQDPSYHMLFIDTSASLLGADEFNKYIENMAHSNYQAGKDNSLSKQFSGSAKEILKQWKARIVSGEFTVYADNEPTGRHMANISDLHSTFACISIDRYKDGIEQFKVIDTMFTSSNFKQGASCGAKQELTGTFRSTNKETQLETALAGAWKVDNYWELSEARTLLISRLKIVVEDVISTAFKRDGKVSIAQIYEKLKSAPCGLLPCNLAAFILGFILKEYANDKYHWSDGQVSDKMSIDKLKEMIDEIFNPRKRYKNKYILKMTPEDQYFNEMTAAIFNIPENCCVSIEQTRTRLRTKMTELSFPLWCLKEITGAVKLETQSYIIAELIDAYCDVANSNNRSDSNADVEITKRIGKLGIDNKPEVINDLNRLVTKENCLEGMKAFISSFEAGTLVSLADKIGDNGDYINVIRRKIDANDANWVWYKETVENIIRETIVDYRIIEVSNKVNTKTNLLEDTVNVWCDRLNQIKVSYDVIKQDVAEDLRLLLEILVSIKRLKKIEDNKKNQFLSLLAANQAELKTFLTGQLDIFKSVCSFYIDGLPDEVVEAILHNMPPGMLTLEKSEYLRRVQMVVDGHKKSMGITKLKRLWQDKAGTKTPQEWSIFNKMSIMCMVDDEDILAARNAFDVIRRTNPDQMEIQHAIDFLQQTSLFEILNDSSAKDSLFLEKVVKSYSSLLPDPNEVRNHLVERMTCEPYDWFQNPEVDKKISDLAESKYHTGGCDQALLIIDTMEAEQLKVYLKQLVKDNMIVGIEIISNS